jgi:CRP-like cAMP-binding protein
MSGKYLRLLPSCLTDLLAMLLHVPRRQVSGLNLQEGAVHAEESKLRESRLSMRNQPSDHSIRHFRQNGLLGRLPDAVLQKLEAKLERVPLRRRQVLQDFQLPITRAYFIVQGSASLLARSEGEPTLEVCALGCSDMTGVPLVLGMRWSITRCVVQIPGEAFRISADDLVQVLDELPNVRSLLLAYVHAALAQSTSLIVCNTRHSARERLARWLSLAIDRSPSNQIPITHDLLARAIGVRRATVSSTMAALEEHGVLRRHRGCIEVRQQIELERMACSCVRGLRLARLRALGREEPRAAA